MPLKPRRESFFLEGSEEVGVTTICTPTAKQRSVGAKVSGPTFSASTDQVAFDNPSPEAAIKPAMYTSIARL